MKKSNDLASTKFNLFFNNCKRGVSPRIVTFCFFILVIGLCVGFFAFLQFSPEETLELSFNGEIMPLEEACRQIDISIGYSSPYLSLSNEGDMNLHDARLEITNQGDAKVFSLLNLLGEDWPLLRIDGPDSEKIINLDGFTGLDIKEDSDVRLVPVLLAEVSDRERRPFICERNYFPLT